MTRTQLSEIAIIFFFMALLSVFTLFRHCFGRTSDTWLLPHDITIRYHHEESMNGNFSDGSGSSIKPSHYAQESWLKDTIGRTSPTCYRYLCLLFMRQRHSACRYKVRIVLCYVAFLLSGPDLLIIHNYLLELSCNDTSSYHLMFFSALCPGSTMLTFSMEWNNTASHLTRADKS